MMLTMVFNGLLFNNTFPGERTITMVIYFNFHFDGEIVRWINHLFMNTHLLRSYLPLFALALHAHVYVNQITFEATFYDNN